MKKGFAILLVSILVSLSAASAETMSAPIKMGGRGSNNWFVFLSKSSSGVDQIQVVNPLNSWAENYLMSQADVSPSVFALTYSSLKDALINDDKVDVIFWYEDAVAPAARKLNKIGIVPIN